MRHIITFNEKYDMLDIVKDIIDWKLIERIEYYLTEYWDKGINIALSMSLNEYIYYFNNNKKRFIDNELFSGLKYKNERRICYQITTYSNSRKSDDVHYNEHKYIFDGLRKFLNKKYDIQYLEHHMGFWFEKYKLKSTA